MVDRWVTRVGERNRSAPAGGMTDRDIARANFWFKLWFIAPVVGLLLWLVIR